MKWKKKNRKLEIVNEERLEKIKLGGGGKNNRIILKKYASKLRAGAILDSHECTPLWI